MYIFIYIYTYISQDGPVLEPLGGPDLDSAPSSSSSLLLSA